MTDAAHTFALTPADRRDRRFGWLMASPSLAILFLVILFPVFWALFTSLHDYTLIAPNFDTFTGIGNFTKALEDGEFRHTLWLTAFFVLGRGAAGIRARLPGGADAEQRRARSSRSTTPSCSARC